MSLNRLYDVMLALSPRWMLRMNETSGTTVADASGNGLDFTSTATLTGTTGPFHTSKNDAATNKVATLGTSNIKRADITNTVENIETTGISLVLWIKCTGTQTYTTPFDCRKTTARNGLALMFNTRAPLAGSADSASLFITDPSGGSSYLKFTDSAHPTVQNNFWGDSRWHMYVIKVIRNKATGGLIKQLYLDGIDISADAAASADGATGTFVAPSGTQYTSFGLFADASQDGDDCSVGPSAWYNRLLSDEEILSIYHAAAYTVGDATYGYAAMSINGGFHAEADQGVYKPDAATVAAVGDYVGRWDNLAGYGSAAVNSNGDYRNPKLWRDPMGRLAVMFDGCLQNNADGGACPRPFLVAGSPGAANAMRMGLFVCAAASSVNIVGAGPLRVMTRLYTGANHNKIDLRINSGAATNQVGLAVDTTEYAASNTNHPVPRCIGGVPGVFGISTGTGGTTGDGQVWTNGIASAINGSVASAGFFYLPLNSSIVLGTPDAAKGFFSGFMHACFDSGRTLHPIESANLTAYWNHRWSADRADTHILLTATSIESGTVDDAVLGVTDMKIWQYYLPTSIQRRSSLANASVGGQVSGPLKRADGTNTNVTDATVLLTDQRLDYGQWYQRGANNPNNDYTTIWIAEDFTNDVVKSQAGNDALAGTTYPQSLVNFTTNRTRVRSQAPRCKIVEVFGPSSVYGSDVNYAGITAYMIAHTEIVNAVVQITGITNWVHPYMADGPIIAGQVAAKVAPLMPARAGGGGSRARGRLAFEAAR